MIVAASVDRPQFLSTPSARRATRQTASSCTSRPISIHALREEGDDVIYLSAQLLSGFLSTPSARRATASELLPGVWLVISIHALREEGDMW